MTGLWARICAAFLAVALTVTSLSVAVSRGHTHPVDHLEICQGLTVVRVAVDAEGQPISPVHLCPDVLGTLFAAAGVIVPITAPEPIFVSLRTLWRDDRRVARADVVAQARGPPRCL